MTSRINSAFIILLAVSFAGPAFAQGPGADVYKAATPKCAMCHGAPQKRCSICAPRPIRCKAAAAIRQGSRAAASPPGMARGER